MATGIYSWSQTAATNATADSEINWAEGQAPSTVNDSARAVMRVLSKWRDDISGVAPSNVVLTTGGTANAQTLATNASIAALTNGWTVSFLAGSGLSNTGACTLAVDSLVAKNIQRISGTNLVGGEIVAGCVYTVTYHQPTDTWVLQNFPPMAGEVLLVNGTVSSAATLSLVLTAYTQFRAIKFVLTGFQPATDGADLIFRTSTDGGSNYDAGASDYSYSVQSHQDDTSVASVNDDTADTSIVVAEGLGNASTASGNFEVTLYNPTSAAFHTQVGVNGSYIDTDGKFVVVSGGGRRATGANVDAARFLFSTGNIDEGGYAVYGLR
jgi:hypothetical protein